MSVSDTPRDLRSQKTSENLSAAAMELFMLYGVEKVTIDDICGRCGVTKGAFYHYFPSKDYIVTYAINHNMDRYVMEHYCPEEGEDVAARLLRLQRVSFTFFRELGKDLTRFSFEGQVRSLIELKDRERFYVQTLEDIVGEGVRSGAFVSRLSEAECYLENIVVYSGLLLKWATTPEKLDPIYHWETMLEELVSGLLVRKD